MRLAEPRSQPPGSVPTPTLGSPLPAAAWRLCLLPTSHSHSTLPPPSAEVGLGLRAPSPASSHPHSTALLLLLIGTGMHNILLSLVTNCRQAAPCLWAEWPFPLLRTLTVMAS